MNILIFDPRGIALASKDSLNRHIFYAKEIKKLNAENSLHIFTFRKVMDFIENDLSVNNLNFINLTNISKFKKYLNEFEYIIFGEPFFAPTIFRIITKFLHIKKDFKIQIQIHGDFGNTEWEKQGINKIKFKFLKFNLKFATSLRFVSKTQYINLANITRPYQEICIAPIPVFLNNLEIPFYFKHRPMALGVLGRVEEERGFSNLISFLTSFPKNNAPRIFIAGSGSRQNELIDFINRNNLETQVIFLGFIPQKEIEMFWKSIGVLLNFAPTESYGLSMRESLIRGIPVISSRNTGAMEILKFCPKAHIKLVDEFNYGVLHELIDHMCRLETTSEFRSGQIQIDIKAVNDLIKSWQI